MSEITLRQQALFRLIVENFIQTAVPVGSKHLSESSDLRISSATIRNEMGVLEEMGFLMHPHTSAGRVPTEAGYRFYVQHLMQPLTVSVNEAKQLQTQLEDHLENFDKVIEHVSRILAGVSRQAGIIVYPDFSQLVFKHVSLKKAGKKQLQVEWHTLSGWVKHFLVSTSEGIDVELIKKLENFLNEELADLSPDEMHSVLEKYLKANRDHLYHLYMMANAIVDGGVSQSEKKIVLEGRDHLLDHPEYQDITKTKNMLRALENKEALVQVFELVSTDIIRIEVGHGAGLEGVEDCALIKAKCQLQNGQNGTVGVVGPMRMDYRTITSQVQHLAEFLTSQFGEQFNA